MTPTIPITWTKRPLRWPRLTVGLVLAPCLLIGALALGWMAVVVAYIIRSIPLSPPLLLSTTGVCLGGLAVFLMMRRG